MTPTMWTSFNDVPHYVSPLYNPETSPQLSQGAVNSRTMSNPFMGICKDKSGQSMVLRQKNWVFRVVGQVIRKA